jgi:hypothetical protein
VVVVVEVSGGDDGVQGSGVGLVGGAPLPTEIRLISQGLPEGEDVHSD